MQRAEGRIARVEEVLRTFAMTGLDESINGIPCRQLTPRHIDLLLLANSPFLYKRESRKKYRVIAQAEEVAQFLWIVSPTNPLNGAPPPADFFKTLRPDEPVYFRHFYRAIDRYYDRAMIDQTHGSGNGRVVPTALSVSMINRIAAAYGWPAEVLDRKGRPIPGKGIMDMPVARLNQFVMWIRVESDSGTPIASKLRDRVHVRIVLRWHARAKELGVSVDALVKGCKAWRARLASGLSTLNPQPSAS